MDKCKTCNGKGVVLADLPKFRFGDGFMAFMRAGCKRVDGRVDRSFEHYHEIVCIRCDGSGEEPRA
jgi:hypothetical protein